MYIVLLMVDIWVGDDIPEDFSDRKAYLRKISKEKINVLEKIYQR